MAVRRATLAATLCRLTMDCKIVHEEAKHGLSYAKEWKDSSKFLGESPN